MATAGCMALCIQTDNTACEALGNYRGVGGDHSALFLPSPQIFGQLKARPGSRSCWRLLWQQLRSSWVIQCSLLHPRAAALPGPCGAPGSSTGKMWVRAEHWTLGKAGLGGRAAASGGLCPAIEWQRSAHLHSAPAVEAGAAPGLSGESPPKQSRESKMLRET